MVKVRQWEYWRKRWVTHEFNTRTEAVHYVASYRIIGWLSAHIYIIEEDSTKDNYVSPVTEGD